MKKIKNWVLKIIRFVTIDIWRIRLENLPKNKLFLIRYLRITFLAIREFRNDKCSLRASALTFYSLLSIVPILAVGFGIAKGYGLERFLEKQLMDNFKGQEEALNWMLNLSGTLIENTKGGVMAGISLVCLFWIVIKLLNHIEDSFNDIWEVKKPRPLVQKFTDYLAITLIAPILMVTASSATVFVRSHIHDMENQLTILGYVTPFLFTLLRLSPYVLIWLFFTVFFMIMPNAKVKFKSAFVGGIISGTVFQFCQWQVINLQVEVVNINTIYGSFAALPLFLGWMQLSWMIVLIGAEISFAHQNVDKYEFETDTKNISFHFKKQISLLMMHLLIKRFENSERPLTTSEISETLKIPVRLTRQLVDELVEEKIISKTLFEDEKRMGYQPARDINKITVKEILEKLEKRGSSDIPVADTEEFKKLSKTLESFNMLIEQSPENKLLKDI